MESEVHGQSRALRTAPRARRPPSSHSPRNRPQTQVSWGKLGGGGGGGSRGHPRVKPFPCPSPLDTTCFKNPWKGSHLDSPRHGPQRFGKALGGRRRPGTHSPGPRPTRGDEFASRGHLGKLPLSGDKAGRGRRSGRRAPRRQPLSAYLGWLNW